MCAANGTASTAPCSPAEEKCSECCRTRCGVVTEVAAVVSVCIEQPRLLDSPQFVHSNAAVQQYSNTAIQQCSNTAVQQYSNTAIQAWPAALCSIKVEPAPITAQCCLMKKSSDPTNPPCRRTHSVWQQLLAVLLQVLQPPHGVVYVAAKSFYFGVGGSVASFMQLVQEDGVLECKQVRCTNCDRAKPVT